MEKNSFHNEYYNIMLSQHSYEKDVYQSYLIRFWREHAHVPWRVVLVHVPTGEERRFTSTDALFLYLHQQTMDPDGLQRE
jgi:hypothetical protein